MATFSYEETEYRYNPYTRQIEPVGVDKNSIVETVNASEEWLTINADRLNVSDVFAQDILATWSITWSTIRTSWSNSRVEMESNWLIAYAWWTKRLEVNGTWTWRLEFFKNDWVSTWYLQWNAFTWIWTEAVGNLYVTWDMIWSSYASSLWTTFEEWDTWFINNLTVWSLNYWWTMDILTNTDMNYNELRRPAITSQHKIDGYTFAWMVFDSGVSAYIPTYTI